MAHDAPTFVHFFGEDAVRWMEILGVAAGEDPIDLVVLNPGLELGAELCAEGQALFFPCEIHDVVAGIHHRRATGG